jgi:hypothetical protein
VTEEEGFRAGVRRIENPDGAPPAFASNVSGTVRAGGFGGLEVEEELVRWAELLRSPSLRASRHATAFGERRWVSQRLNPSYALSISDLILRSRA